MSSETIRLTINGRPVEAPAGSTILQAALAAGIYIPHLCDHENLRHTANCRMCMVKIAGRQGVHTACSTPAEEGMEVDVQDEQAEAVRKLSLDFLVKTHPAECTGCPKFGRCQLQAIMQAVGDTGRDLRGRPILRPTDGSNPIVLHEMTRCILCGRCVRACEELRGVGALEFAERDGRMEVAVKGGSLAEAGCRFCGACIEVCPTGSIREQVDIAESMEGKPREAALLPCKDGCPAHIDIPKYLRFIREEDYPAAVATIREKAPFPHALGYICTHKCETGCRRGYLNDPVAIRDAKRFACERDDGSWREKSVQKPPTGRSVAVVGGGPGGLTAAYYLAKQGHEVTVFEAQPKAGGMMRYGIPAYRLPREIVDGEIADIERAGVEIKTGVRVDEPGKLLGSGYDAVLVAVGTHAGVRLPIAGSELPGVHVNTEFLRAAEMGTPPDVGGRVVVLGGGNVALDCAGIARRLGAKEVHAACLEAPDAMTSTPEEFEWAREEGLVMHNSKTFLEIVEENGRAAGVRIAGIRSFSFDETGKSHIELEPGSEEVLPADTVIFATGQRPDIGEGFGLALGRGNRIAVEENGETSLPGVFAAGDAVTGTDSVIRAIEGGRQAAKNIDRFLGGAGDIDETLAPPQQADPVLGNQEGFAGLERRQANLLPAEERVCGFATMDLGYGEEETCCEAARCLQCDLRLQIAPQKFWSDYEPIEAAVSATAQREEADAG